ncbi:MAG: glycosyltransferase [Mesorhizobium sp.]
MKISFLNNSSIAFDPRTPLNRPLGGTESAVAYLASALTQAGVQVTLFNHSTAHSVVDGVRVVPVTDAPPEVLADCDLLVIVSCAIGSEIRSLVGDRVPMLLWGHHDIDQPAIARLSEPDERAAFDGHVMVSHWQAQRFVAQFSLRQQDVHVIGNGVSPAVLAQPVGPAWYEIGNSPTLVYSSTPYRGLDVLLQCFPAIRALVPDVRLRIHSSMNIYGIGLEMDACKYLYVLAKSLRGVDYVGPVSQSELAKSLSSVAASGLSQYLHGNVLHRRYGVHGKWRGYLYDMLWRAP